MRRRVTAVLRSLAHAAGLVLALVASPASAQWTQRLELEHGAFDHRPGVPDAIVHAPAAFDPRGPLHLVVFLHGYRGCADVLAASGPSRCRAGGAVQPGWDLLARHDEAGTSTLFVIAQLALDARDGSPGRFARDGGFRTFLDEVLRRIGRELGASRATRDVASITLAAHSAAFESTLAILRAGGVPISGVVLLDALYAGGPAFLAWVSGDHTRRLISVHTGAGTTALRNRDLARRARRSLGDAFVQTDDLAEVGPSHRVAIVRVRTPHREVPARHLAATLRVLSRSSASVGRSAGRADVPTLSQRR